MIARRIVTACSVAAVVVTSFAVAVTAPAVAKPKVGDPTSWQTGLCSRMRQFAYRAGGGFTQLRDFDSSTPPEEVRMGLIRALDQVATEAGVDFHLDGLGSLPVAKPQAITGPLQHELSRARKKFDAAVTKAKKLTAPINTADPGLRAIDADLAGGMQIYSNAMHHIYGATGDARFDRTITANGECDFIADLPTSTSTA